ncbi:MAG: amidohydrolase family protein [Gemmataceae bacterium]
MSKRFVFLAAFLALSLAGVFSYAPAQRTGGLQPTVFAIKNARVIPEPGKVISEANVVIRDGLIEAVGPGVKIPPEALTVDGKGLTVYAGFIDGLSNWGFDPALQRSEGGAPAVEDTAAEALAVTKPDNRKGMTPEFTVATALKAEDELADNWRKAGFTAHLVAPEGGIIVGQSALVSLSNRPPREALLRTPVAMHAAFRTNFGSPDYPRALMGIIAHTRQTFLDAGHYHREWAAFEKRGRAGLRPPQDPALASLGPVLSEEMAIAFEADSKDSIHRALDIAEEFKLKPMIFGGSDAWKVADRLKKAEVPVLLKLNFAEGQPNRRGRLGGGRPPVATPAPGTPPAGNRPARPDRPPADLGQPPAEEEKDLPARVKEDNERKQKEERANAGVLNKQGVAFAFCTQGVSGDKPWDKFRENLRKAIKEGLSPEAALKALTVDAARIFGVDKQLGTVEPGKAAHLIVTDGDFQDAKTQIRYVFSDGVRFEYEGKKPEEKKPDAPKPEVKKPEGEKAEVSKADDKTAAGKPEGKKAEDKKVEDKPADKKAKEEQATEIEADRKPKLHTGGNLLIRNAMLITVANGAKPKTDLLIQNGKIAGIGTGLKAPDGVQVLDADGLFVMPGIIDTHSHFAIEGGVNEFSLSVVPEVRVRDVIQSEDVQIYRALAGGVTTARLLHGSSNVIGGQDAVIKLKYGEPASKLLIADAPRGVKFALGENVKRTDGRFPNSRLGVEAVLIRAFSEAQAYRKTWEDYEKARQAGGVGLPSEPRRDLRLEALADVLKGDLKVHCHCYRADEILMLLRVADRFGFKIKSLQHVLEGYKIASEIADHGASCSTFSDWWAYKIEAYDAIPFNSSLLNEAGVTVCIKSDSNELMRHLYQEAAKCIKYGGMSEEEAFKTITLNGAKQLGLDKRLGSIEVGKDADLAVFNGHPLNDYSRVEMTLVDGEVYFQNSDKPAPCAAAKSEPAKPGKEFKLPAAGSERHFTLRNVILHQPDGSAVQDGTVIIRDGRIEKAGKLNGDTEAGGTVINATGLHLYPGMIDAATVLGLTELGSARETHDFSEGGDFQPDLRASIAINADSELIPVTRANGVLSVVTRPTGSIIAGQSALINLAGWVPKEMVLVDPLALQVDFPVAMPVFSGDPSAPSVGRAIAKKQREEKIRRLKELFAQALAYDDAKKQGADRPVNPRLEALVPYARGRKPVVIQANRKAEIQEALKLADELKIKMILSGGIEAWKVTGELKKRDVPVIVGPIMTMPQEAYDPYDAPFACPARLHQAGIKFCIRSAGSTNTRNLPYEAAMAVSYGLPPEEGLKAVTLYPAQILGVGDQLGSIETGKRANLVLADGDILQASTQVKALFIDGKPLEPISKQTRLYERYRERLKEVKEGRAPLGTK